MDLISDKSIEETDNYKSSFGMISIHFIAFEPHKLKMISSKRTK